MRAIVLVVAVVGFAACAQALAAQRTFVRSDGVDTNPCSIASPCRSFAAAIAATDPDGEIVVLDSAGYGSVAVNKGVTITAPPRIYAGISVPSGSDGIDVSASGEKVVLRGLAINGQGGSIGIAVLAAAELHIEYCIVSNMILDGIRIASGGAVYVDHVVVRSNGTNGILVGSGSGADLFVDDTRIANNVDNGIYLNSGKTTLNRIAVENNESHGIFVLPISGSDARLFVRDSVIAGNTGFGVGLSAGTVETARAELEHTSIVRNGSSGLNLQSSGAAATAHMSNANASGNGGYGAAAYDGTTLTVMGSTLTRNAAYGMYQSGSGTLRSPGNNIVDGNALGGTNGTITPITPM